MIGLLLFLQLPSDIVVNGQRLEEVQAACARGGCTPVRDAQATIALAEVRFRDGQYRGAKALLAAATSRNAKNAAAAPRAVAALYEAYATVALHEGSKLDYRRATVKQVETLRDNLPADDPAVVAAVTALGDMWIELQRYGDAEAAFSAAEQRAIAAGQEGAAFTAAMKRAWVAAARGHNDEATAMLDALEQRPIAQQASYRSALRVLRLRLRLAAGNADSAEVDRLVAEVGQGQYATPPLVFSPAYESDAISQANAMSRRFDMKNAVDIASSETVGIRWADIGFWVRPDGHTSDIEMLRGNGGQAWIAPALQQIAGRRYAVGKGEDGMSGQGIYRVERFTLRTDDTVPVGSLIARRAATGGYDVLDLAEAPAAPPID